jgi:hypothetical protein
MKTKRFLSVGAAFMVKAAVVLVLVLAAGCSAANTPTAAVRAYYKAVEKNDLKSLVKVLTEQGAQNITGLDAETLAVVRGAVQEYVAALGAVKSETEEIDGDNAVVTVTFENGEEKVSVIKVDGKWKVTEFD